MPHFFISNPLNTVVTVESNRPGRRSSSKSLLDPSSQSIKAFIPSVPLGGVQNGNDIVPIVAIVACGEGDDDDDDDDDDNDGIHPCNGTRVS